jgi:hypothetical protein
MMEALSSSETSVLTRATRRNIAEGGIIHLLYIFREGNGIEAWAAYFIRVQRMPLETLALTQFRTRDQFFSFFHGNYCKIFAVSLIRGALSDERTGL